jgi:Protein of unknown function (DUF3307)
MIQLILHLIGDYVTQSDWMAQNKTKSTWAAFCHATVYALPFLAIASLNAWLVIWLTHLIIDRYRLARYVVWAKNFMAPVSDWKPWAECSGTGYHKDSPPWLSVWLMIAADNTLHLGINYLAIAAL